MWTWILLGLVTATVAMSVEKEFQDGDRKSAFELKIEELERKVAEEREQIDAWRLKIELLEDKFHHVRRGKQDGKLTMCLFVYIRQCFCYCVHSLAH